MRRALAEADYRRLLDTDAISAALGRGRPGSGTLRRAVARHQPRYAWTRSRLERSLLRLCERYDIPLPRFNVVLKGWLVDALWAEQRVVVEVDGYLAHRTRAQLERDHERDLQLRAAGFIVARYTETQIDERPGEVADDLRSLLGLRPTGRRGHDSWTSG